MMKGYLTRKGMKFRFLLLRHTVNERNLYICSDEDDDDVFYKLCKQSWCEENYIVVYHDV